MEKGRETSSVFRHLNCMSIRAVRSTDVHIVATMTHRKTHSSFAVCASLPTTAQRSVICNRNKLKLLHVALGVFQHESDTFYWVLLCLTTIVCHLPSIFCHVGCYNAINTPRGSDNRQLSDKITTLLLQDGVIVCDTGTRAISTQIFCNYCQTSILKCMNSRQGTSVHII